MRALLAIRSSGDSRFIISLRFLARFLRPCLQLISFLPACCWSGVTRYIDSEGFCTSTCRAHASSGALVLYDGEKGPMRRNFGTH
jgi:hypothetical protein